MTAEDNNEIMKVICKNWINVSKRSEVEREVTIEWSDHKREVCDICYIFNFFPKFRLIR